LPFDSGRPGTGRGSAELQQLRHRRADSKRINFYYFDLQ